MNNLSFGWWNSTKLHVLRINDVKDDDVVVTAKLKLMEMGHINNVNELDFIYCGLLMENTEPIFKYIKNGDSLIFMVKKENSFFDETTISARNDLQKMFQEYKDASMKPGFKELLMNTMNSETINQLLDAIPEISEDLVALSIIKNNHLFESILEPEVMKMQLTKHPALLLCADYLSRKKLKKLTGRMRSLAHLTDEDFSESDDIEIDYNQGNASTFELDNFPEFDLFIRGNNRNNSATNETEGVIRTLFEGNVFENVLMDVPDDHNGAEQQFENPTHGLSSQLHQMHELGLFNDLLNFRALQIAGGNVQYAIEMILNKIIE